jgi:hypothetical protein
VETSPVKYELGFYIPQDGILRSHRRKNLKSYIALTGGALWWRSNMSPVRYELSYIPEGGILHSHRCEDLKPYKVRTDLSQALPSMKIKWARHAACTGGVIKKFGRTSCGKIISMNAGKTINVRIKSKVELCGGVL